MRAQLKKRQRNRRIIIVSVVVALGAIVTIGAFLLSTLGTPLEKDIGQPVPPTLYQIIYTASQANYGTANQSLASKVQSFTGAPFTSGTKPIVIYIGAEYCPYCAFQRWPLIMALMRFGNFSNLQYMLSSSTDVYPNSPTFTFLNAKYTSDYVVFQGFEQEDRSEDPLQTVPSNYSSVFSQFGDNYPFIDFANKYIMSGSFYFPSQLDGKNWTQIAQLLSSSNVVSNQILSSADVITAVICKTLPNPPSGVCANSEVSSLVISSAAYRPASGSNQVEVASWAPGFSVGSFPQRQRVGMTSMAQRGRLA